MAEKINFTKSNLDAIDCPAGMPRRYVYDLKTPGLQFCVTAKGARSFYRYGRVNGRPQRLFLGAYPDMTPEQARDAAKKATGEVVQGVDPAERKRVARGEMTFGELFNDWRDRHAKLHKKSWDQDQDNYDNHLADWGPWKLSRIKRADVTTLHTKIGADAPYMANRVLALASTLFNWAIEEHDYDHANPAKGVTRFREQSRERFLRGDELPRFFKALDDETNQTMRDFFKMCLFTGARRSNVQAMKWEEVNVQRAEWVITAAAAKAGKSITVPLVPEAIAILKERMGNGSAYVFDSYGKSGHLAEPKTAWAKLLERAKLEDLRIHDLRRTLGSWQAATGASLHVIGKSLGHQNQSTTAIYSRLDLDPVRRSVSTATAAIMAASRKRGPKKSKGGGGEGGAEQKALPAPSQDGEAKKSKGRRGKSKTAAQPTAPQTPAAGARAAATSAA
jgi:integrase